MRCTLKGLIVISIGLGVLFLPACGRDTPTNTPESPIEQMSPQLESPLDAPTPVPPTATPVALEVPTPAPGLGVVHGSIESVSPETRMYLAGEIYLAPQKHTEGETSLPLIRLEVGKDPKATLRNEANEFAIVDVPPGEYGLVLHTPINDYIITDESGGFRIIDVKADQVMDLGVIELR